MLNYPVFEQLRRVLIVTVNDIFFFFICSALGLWFIVCRTKQCLDFAVTLHCVHFFVCWIYNGHIPHTASWWILNLVGVTLMTVLGEFLCMRTEMKAIPLSMGPKVDL